MAVGCCVSSAFTVNHAKNESADQSEISVGYNKEGFLRLFGEEAVPSGEGIEPTVSYEYEMYLNDMDETCVDLTLTFSLGGASYTLHPTGTIVSFQTADGRTMFSGPLEDTVEIGGIEYLFLVGFHQYAGENRAHFTATITPLSGDGDMMVIDFGHDISAQPPKAQDSAFDREEEPEILPGAMQTRAVPTLAAVWIAAVQRIFLERI